MISYKNEQLVIEQLRIEPIEYKDGKTLRRERREQKRKGKK